MGGPRKPEPPGNFHPQVSGLSRAASRSSVTVWSVGTDTGSCWRVAPGLLLPVSWDSLYFPVCLSSFQGSRTVLRKVTHFEFVQHFFWL